MQTSSHDAPVTTHKSRRYPPLIEIFHSPVCGTSHDFHLPPTHYHSPFPPPPDPIGTASLPSVAVQAQHRPGTRGSRRVYTCMQVRCRVQVLLRTSHFGTLAFWSLFYYLTGELHD